MNNYLLKNANVLTMDEDFNHYEPGGLVISNDQIVAVGPEDEIIAQYSNNVQHIIDCEGKIVMPGFINAHTHAPMTLLRGLADDLRLDVWLMGYMLPVEREFVSPAFVRLGTQLACAEMIRCGTTTFADMYYFEEDVAKASAEAGMRSVCGQTVLKFPSPDASSYEEGLAIARDFIKRWKDHPLVIPSIAPHAPYTCTDDILESAAALALEFDVPLQIHLAETAAEVENMRSATGMPVIPYIKKHNLLDTKLIAAHCVHIDEGEIRSLAHAGAGLVHNPSSNMKLASGIAPIAHYLELGAIVGIGTDGPASNNDLDMFEETRLAAFLAKGSTGDPTTLPARTTLLLATRFGAKALHIDHLTGSLEIGKRADLIFVAADPLHNLPRFRRDPNACYAQVVYASHAADVSDVMINGKWVMRASKLLTLNEKELLKASQTYAQKIDAFLVQREQSVLSKLIAIGGALEEESFEIQAKVPITSSDSILMALLRPEIEILRQRHYREYDTYFSFDNPQEGFLRYREDHFVGEKGEITKVRNRLTLVGPIEEHLPQEVLLSRSRYLAPATQSLRFYREYFKPASETQIDKDRLRYLIRYQNTEFFVNIDTVTNPALGNFLEVKSRTWSRQDAQQKSQLVAELISFLGASTAKTVSTDYVVLVENQHSTENPAT